MKENKEAIEGIIKKHPLSALSLIIHVQAENLLNIGEDVNKMIDDVFLCNRHIEGSKFNKTYGYITLWIFGAYELLRTLDDQYGDCFLKKLN